MESTADMKKAILDFIRNEYAEENQEVNENTPLISGGLVDSFSLVSLKRFLEKRYSITIPDEKASSEVFDSVSRICALVEECAR
mgnify:CR=1 FL=1